MPISVHEQLLIDVVKVRDIGFDGLDEVLDGEGDHREYFVQERQVFRVDCLYRSGQDLAQEGRIDVLSQVLDESDAQLQCEALLGGGSGLQGSGRAVRSRTSDEAGELVHDLLLIEHDKRLTISQRLDLFKYSLEIQRPIAHLLVPEVADEVRLELVLHLRLIARVDEVVHVKGERHRVRLLHVQLLETGVEAVELE